METCSRSSDGSPSGDAADHGAYGPAPDLRRGDRRRVAEHLTGGGFESRSAEAVLARESLEKIFDAGNPNLVLFADSKSGSVDGRRAAGMELTSRRASEPHVTEVVSYSSAPAAFRRRVRALVLAGITGSEDEIVERAERLSTRYERGRGPPSVRVGGRAEVFSQVSEQIEEDLAGAQLISFRSLTLLMLVFGSVVAASLSLGVGVIAIFGTLFVLKCRRRCPTSPYT